MSIAKPMAPFFAAGQYIPLSLSCPAMLVAGMDVVGRRSARGGGKKGRAIRLLGPTKRGSPKGK